MHKPVASDRPTRPNPRGWRGCQGGGGGKGGGGQVFFRFGGACWNPRFIRSSLNAHKSGAYNDLSPFTTDGWLVGWYGVLVPSAQRAPPRISLYCGCLFRLMRHPGNTTAMDEARVKRLCGALCCVLSQQLLLGGGGGGSTGNRRGGCLAQSELTGRLVYQADLIVDPHTVRHGHCLVHAPPSQWLRVTSPLW